MEQLEQPPDSTHLPVFEKPQQGHENTRRGQRENDRSKPRTGCAEVNDEEIDQDPQNQTARETQGLGRMRGHQQSGEQKEANQ